MFAENNKKSLNVMDRLLLLVLLPNLCTYFSLNWICTIRMIDMIDKNIIKVYTATWTFLQSIGVFSLFSFLSQSMPHVHTHTQAQSHLSRMRNKTANRKASPINKISNECHVLRHFSLSLFARCVFAFLSFQWQRVWKRARHISVHFQLYI